MSHEQHRPQCLYLQLLAQCLYLLVAYVNPGLV